MYWLYLLAGVALDILGTFSAKKFITEHEWWWFVLIFIAKGTAILLWIEFLRNGNLGVLNTLWIVGLMLGVITISYLFFREPLSVLQVAGLTLCVFGIILLQWPTK